MESPTVVTDKLRRVREGLPRDDAPDKTLSSRDSVVQVSTGVDFLRREGGDIYEMQTKETK